MNAVVLLLIGLLLTLWLPSVLWAISSLSVTHKASMQWTASNSLTGSDYGQNTNATTIQKTSTMGTTAANAAVGGGDELYSAVTSLAGGASASIDFTAITDILQTAGVSLARIKGILIRLLSTTDDTSIGTAATSINIDNTVSNALSSQAGSGWFANAAEGGANGSKFCIPNGGWLDFGTPAAAGVLVDGTHKVLKVTNNDGAVTAKVQVSVMGGSS